MKKTILQKTIFVMSMFAFIMLQSHAQVKSKKVDILWGSEQKESSRKTLSDIAGYDKTGIYTVKTSRFVMGGYGSSLTLEHYNNDMNLTKSVELELTEQKKEKEFEFIVQLNTELYLFSSFKNQKLKQNFLFVQSINKKTLELNNDLKMIAEINYADKSKYNAGGFNYELSRDSSKFLIYYTLPYDKVSSEKYGFHVFDNKMTELWTKEITLPYKEELFDIGDYKVDNNGNVHVLGLIFNDKRKMKLEGKPNFKYQVLSYNNKGNDLMEYPVMIQGKYLTDMQIAIDDNQDLICAGFYSSEGISSIEGSYFLKIDNKTKEIKVKKFKEFGVDFITQNMTERQEKKTKKQIDKGKDVEMYQYALDDIILRDDGGALLVGEQYYVKVVTTTTTSGNGMTTTSTRYYYYYNDIIVINVSSAGDIDWTVKIPKRQLTVNDGGFYSSYTLSVVKDKLYFVFNDNPLNLFYKGEGKLYDFTGSKESLVVLVTLDNEGKQIKEALFNSKEAGIITRPKVCEQISDDELVLFGQRKKNHRFAKISFKA